MLKKKKGYIILAVLSILSSSCSQTKTNQDDSSKDTTLNVPSYSEISTIDVVEARGNETEKILTQIGEGLFSYNNKGELVTALAEEIVEPTNDGLTYVFNIRKNAKWSNGEPVTAHDFEYSWKRTVSYTSLRNQHKYFGGIKNFEAIDNREMEPSELGVKALDDYKLEVTLEYPMNYFQQKLAYPVFYPLKEDFVKEKGNYYGRNSESTLYNGPFIMKNWDGEIPSWTYEKNKEYWDKENVKIQKVEAHAVKDVSTGKNMFNRGLLDIIRVNGEVASKEKDNKNLFIRQLPETYCIEMNLNNELLSNKDARKAISLALDSRNLTENMLQEGSNNSLGFIPRGFINSKNGKDFAEEVGDINQSNIHKAQRLWNKAKKETGVSERDFELTISYSTIKNDLKDFEYYAEYDTEKISEYIKKRLSNLEGVTIYLSQVSEYKRLESTSRSDLNLYLTRYTPAYADPVSLFKDLNLIMENVTTEMNGVNGTFTKLIEDAEGKYANDYEKRWQTLIEADMLIQEEAIVVPLFQLSEPYFIQPRVKGIEFGYFGSINYKDLEISN